MHTVLYGLCSHGHHFRNLHVLAMTDSTTCVSVVKSMGSMYNLVHDTIAKDIWRVVEENSCWLSISHLPARFNVESDEGSRVLSSSTEWALPQQTFNNLLQHFRDFCPVVMDLFSSRLNYKVVLYYSYRPDPYSAHVDCFTMACDSRYIY